VSRSILYAEVPGFYAQVERAGRADLSGRPIVVGGDPRKGGLVQAATPDAEAAGVAPGMPVLEALERCPNARALRTDMRHYRDAGVRLYACMRRTCECLEEAGLGAAYIETPEGVDPEDMATALSGRVREELGLPLRVGIGPVKFVARLVAEEAEIEEIQRVAPGELESFLHPLPVSRLDGVGANTQAALAKHDVETVGDLVALGRERLEEILGVRGLDLRALAEGRDPSPVRATRHPKSLSQEVTLPGEEIDTGVLSERLQQLAEALERRLALEGLVTRRVALKLRFADQRTATRSRTLAGPVAEAAEIHAVGLALLRRTQAGARPVRLVGLALSQLGVAERDDRQLELFPRTG
jgi:DNA polymerase-4